MTQPKTNEHVDAIMAAIRPDSFRYRWCGAEAGPCACLGCVQICSRAMMYEIMTGRNFTGDPERIDVRYVPEGIRNHCTITREEWEAWRVRHPQVNPPQHRFVIGNSIPVPGSDP